MLCETFCSQISGIAVPAQWDLVGAQLAELHGTGLWERLFLFNALLRYILICRPQCSTLSSGRRGAGIHYFMSCICHAEHSPCLNQHNMQIEISCKITFRQIQSRNRCLKNTNAGLIKYFIIKYFIHFKNVICENTEIPPQENQNI